MNPRLDPSALSDAGKVQPTGRTSALARRLKDMRRVGTWIAVGRPPAGMAPAAAAAPRGPRPPRRERPGQPDALSGSGSSPSPPTWTSPRPRARRSRRRCWSTSTRAWSSWTRDRRDRAAARRDLGRRRDGSQLHLHPARGRHLHQRRAVHRRRRRRSASSGCKSDWKLKIKSQLDVVEDVEVKDDTTAVVTLDRPSNSFLFTHDHPARRDVQPHRRRRPGEHSPSAPARTQLGSGAAATRIRLDANRLLGRRTGDPPA